MRFVDINVLCCQEIHNNKTFVEFACSVRTGKIMVSFFFCKFMDPPAAQSINLEKQNSTNIFPVWTEQVHSIQFPFNFVALVFIKVYFKRNHIFACLIFFFLLNRRHTRYYGGYHSNHRVVNWLWDVLEKEFNEEEKSRFLKVLDNISINGFQNYTIRVTTSDKTVETILIDLQF